MTPMLLAEELLLLLTADESGKLAVPGTEMDIALGGALLVELTLMRRVDVAGPDEAVRQNRLVVRNPAPTGDELLDEALTLVGQKEGKKPRSVVGRLGKRVRGRLYERLVSAGDLRAQTTRVLGIFPARRWPANDVAHESSVRGALVTALQAGATTDERTGALVSLLVALRAVPKAVDPSSAGLSKRELNARAKRIAEGDWAAKAVRQAIDSMNAAVTGSSSAGVAGGVAGAG
jgi:hypothetical protein